MGMRPRCSMPEPITTSWTPRGDQRGAEVHGLLGRAALAVDASSPVSRSGSPAWSHALRPMFQRCSPNCWTQPVIDVARRARGRCRRARSPRCSSGRGARSGGCPGSSPSRGWPRPIGVRTASTITTSLPFIIGGRRLALRRLPAGVERDRPPVRRPGQVPGVGVGDRDDRATTAPVRGDDADARPVQMTTRAIDANVANRWR